ncbi:hypothetical protein CAOG_01869 [Capsaspora owczarzaki ATCC 30864]|uniref:Uncharacterized protein n=1 Tax=Capsaspora owczarzaki (strain ATCC 30864) TaxID=595528 RepID=A0A0D2U623_CAPO3|nr:hypothetical protein CAOG_01869 [Capsaspora owczarzaki ATCC 30864]KJE90571.1 hypothetical protein CAOG_001869 [Capsaspora owczarzaki ATCC 30864]|eukprot:XP_004364737.1 hypothetical protein CAOG_01869 [Capsaspora owczarzaki ATCC 30864]
MSQQTLFHIAAGSYDRTLYGFDCVAVPASSVSLVAPADTPFSAPGVSSSSSSSSSSNSSSNASAPSGPVSLKSLDGIALQLVAKYVYPAHTGCIKAVALGGGRLLATGSTDETIKLYDIDRKKELGFMIKHEGSITALEFVKDSHLLSASDDGAVCIWRTKDWECLRMMKGHQGPINAIAVHPTGALALTVSKDKHMRTWNLLKGRCAFVTNLKAEFDLVKWAPDGDRYMLITNKTVALYRVEDGEQVLKIECKRRILAACFIDNDHLAVGGEEDAISILSLRDGKVLQTIKGHSNRVRGLTVLPHPSNATSVLLVSASSDCFIKVWNVDPAAKNVHQTAKDCLVQEYTGGRLTCLATTVPATHAEKTTTAAADKQVKRDERRQLHEAIADGKTKARAKVRATEAETIARAQEKRKQQIEHAAAVALEQADQDESDNEEDELDAEDQEDDQDDEEEDDSEEEHFQDAPEEDDDEDDAEEDDDEQEDDEDKDESEEEAVAAKLPPKNAKAKFAPVPSRPLQKQTQSGPAAAPRDKRRADDDAATEKSAGKRVRIAAEPVHAGKQQSNKQNGRRPRKH